MWRSSKASRKRYSCFSASTNTYFVINVSKDLSKCRSVFFFKFWKMSRSIECFILFFLVLVILEILFTHFYVWFHALTLPNFPFWKNSLLFYSMNWPDGLWTQKNRQKIIHMTVKWCILKGDLSWSRPMPNIFQSKGTIFFDMFGFSNNNGKVSWCQNVLLSKP